jgi:hypothetical protein
VRRVLCVIVTKRIKSQKPSPPYTPYLFYAHSLGLWAKRICGRVVYFGSWDDAQAAVDKFLEQRESCYAGHARRE